MVFSAFDSWQPWQKHNFRKSLGKNNKMWLILNKRFNNLTKSWRTWKLKLSQSSRGFSTWWQGDLFSDKGKSPAESSVTGVGTSAKSPFSIEPNALPVTIGQSCVDGHLFLWGWFQKLGDKIGTVLWGRTGTWNI